MTDFRYEHSVEGTGSVEVVWELWSDVSRWPEWDPSLESVTFAGPFSVGSRGTLVIKGQGPISFVLTEIEERTSFVDETSVPGALIRFGHLVEELPEGRLRVSYDVVITGPAAEALGPVVTADLPRALELLVKLAS
ncbi:SRPBCC family protein [Lentzea alba]|uniref:SRPBCC family protein n=1 Tax=Lentzea alba TaxID=2714351 RepID=UPI0039BF8F6A